MLRLLGPILVASLVGCGPVSPYVYVRDVDLTKQTVVQSDSVYFPDSHWVAVVFTPQDFQRLSASDVDNLLSKARYSIQSDQDLRLVRFDESFKKGNTLPPNTLYLFNVVGPGDGQFTVDFSDTGLPVKTFRIAVIKHPAALKDPRVQW